MICFRAILMQHSIILTTYEWIRIKTGLSFGVCKNAELVDLEIKWKTDNFSYLRFYFEIALFADRCHLLSSHMRSQIWRLRKDTWHDYLLRLRIWPVSF